MSKGEIYVICNWNLLFIYLCVARTNGNSTETKRKRGKNCILCENRGEEKDFLTRLPSACTTCTHIFCLCVVCRSSYISVSKKNSSLKKNIKKIQQQHRDSQAAIFAITFVCDRFHDSTVYCFYRCVAQRHRANGNLYVHSRPYGNGNIAQRKKSDVNKAAHSQFHNINSADACKEQVLYLQKQSNAQKLVVFSSSCFILISFPRRGVRSSLSEKSQMRPFSKF